MLDGWNSKLLVLGWGAFLGAFTFLAITDFALIKDARWCGDADEHCLRDWIGALSGWMAAVAAATAIGPLLGQLREQRKQTSFTLGDAMPTVDIERRAHLSLRIRVVNWNRRMLKSRIRIYSTVGEMEIRSILRRTETMGYGDHPYDSFSCLGWEDRSNRPPFNELAIEIENPVDKSATYGPLTVVLSGELIGEGGGVFDSQTHVGRWGAQRG